MGVALALSLSVRAFVAQVFYIPPSGSMRPTVEDHDRVIVSRLAYRLGGPRRGEVVVLDPDGPDDGSVPWRLARAVLQSVGLSQPSTHYLKRVIALSGQTVEGRQGEVLVDGEVLVERYIAEPGRDDFGPVRVPDGHVWVMGDNRNHSSDSRSFGPVPIEHLVGPAVVLVWPPSHLSLL